MEIWTTVDWWGEQAYLTSACTIPSYAIKTMRVLEFSNVVAQVSITWVMRVLPDLLGHMLEMQSVHKQPYFWDLKPWLVYSLLNIYGTPMMINSCLHSGSFTITLKHSKYEKVPNRWCFLSLISFRGTISNANGTFTIWATVAQCSNILRNSVDQCWKITALWKMKEETLTADAVKMLNANQLRTQYLSI